MTVLAGDHFFINSHSQRIAESAARALEPQ
jgi:surfactin synthase thioesterase subunit